MCIYCTLFKLRNMIDEWLKEHGNLDVEFERILVDLEYNYGVKIISAKRDGN